MLTLWLCPLFGFLLGSVPFGLLISKAYGVDIRKHGSGNIGATNVLRVLGKKPGISCLLLDALKGFLPVLIAINLARFHNSSPILTLDFLWNLAGSPPPVSRETAQLIHVLSGLAAILGHNYSPWLGFRGGKGIATSAGVVIALMPFAVIILLFAWFVLFLTTRYVSVASMGAAVLMPLITLWGSWHHGRIQDGTWNKPLFALSCAIALLAVWSHRSNIRRLIDGTENRFQRKPKQHHTPSVPSDSP
jgi:acyl phosphate:glycerol-3-phosphate acyltransferase